MEIDRSSLEVLGSGECLRLLSTARLGRLALNVGALPVVVPVAFVLTDDGIVVPAAHGSELDTATRDTVVAFEADEIDADTGVGWSVVVTGVATHLDEVDFVVRARLRSALGRWSGRRPERFVRIGLGIVAGRRCAAHDADAVAEPVEARLASS